MKARLNPCAALMVPSLALILAPSAAAQNYQQSQQHYNPSYPYQTPGTQYNYGQPQSSYWSRYYGSPQTYTGQPYSQTQQYQTQAYPSSSYPQSQPYQGGYQSPYQGGQYQRPGQYTSQETDQYTQSRGGQSPEQQIRGRVLRTKQLEVPGTDTEILTALVDSTQGRMVVDFGPCDELKENNCQIKKGTDVQAWGHFARAGNTRVFVADSLRMNSTNYDIDRSWHMTTQQLRNEANQFSGMMGQQQQQGYSSGQQGYYGSQQGTSSGQQRQQGQPNYIQQSGQYGQQQGSSSSERVNGRVMQTQKIELPGMQGEIMAALLKTDQGQQMLAILGPQDELHGMQFNKGDEMTVRGPRTWVNGCQVILARSINANGQSTQLNVQRSQTQRISGEVTRTRWIQLPGMRHEVQVACLKSDQGKQVIAILGSEENMGNHEVNRGDEVSVRGELLDVNGQQIVVAQQLRSHGEQTNLNHQPY
jgi:hypothetical protein